MSCRFISFEGIDGAGKSTHIAAVADRLRAAGASVTSTREPGGTALAEGVRELLLRSPMDAMTEVLLVFAARRDHTQSVIRPALARGEVVLCDRYTDATFAYQGAGRGFSLEVLAQLEAWVQEGLEPDLTLWFDLDPALAAARRMRRAADRFEQQDQAFFERVRAGYQRRMDVAPQRFARIDSSQPRAQVWQQIDAALQARGC